MKSMIEKRRQVVVRQILTFFFLFSLFSFLLSCKTAPTVSDPALMTAVPLESGASVYIFADAQEAAPILELLPIPELKDKQTKQMLEMTDFFTAALFPQESGRRFQLAAWGNYPSSRAGMAFGMNKSWKKQRSQSGDYWYSAANRLSIALNSKQAFAASWLHDTHSSPIAVGPGIEYPEGFGEFRQGATLSCWLENPAPMFSRMMEGMGLPLQLPAERLLINLFPTEERYRAEIRMQFTSASQARGIAAAINLARNFMGFLDQDEADSSSLFFALFFANPPVQNERSLDIKTGVLTEKEVTLLFNLFLLY